MKAYKAILAHEQQQINNRLQLAYERLLVYAQECDALCEVVCQMLTSFHLSNAAASLRAVGYPEFLTDSPLERMERVAQFIAYDMMDDGDPGLCWHRHALYTVGDDGDGGFVDCLESDEGAMPYWERRKERREAQTGDHIKLLSAEQVLWTLEWHAKDKRDLNEAVGDLDEWEQCMRDHEKRNHLLYALADEIRALCGDKA